MNESMIPTPNKQQFNGRPAPPPFSSINMSLAMLNTKGKKLLPISFAACAIFSEGARQPHPHSRE